MALFINILVGSKAQFGSVCAYHCLCLSYGTPGKINAIRRIADKHGALIVEDAAESLGATYKGKQTGTFGVFSVISFNGNNLLLLEGEKAA